MGAKETLEANKHIPDSEVLQGIADTEREIRGFEEKIEPRKAFIEKLRYLLALRHPEKTEG